MSYQISETLELGKAEEFIQNVDRIGGTENGVVSRTTDCALAIYESEFDEGDE
jgi:hypothetical protein